MAENLFDKALGDGSQSVTAAIFWLKTRGGWRESPQTHQVGIVDARSSPTRSRMKQENAPRSLQEGALITSSLHLPF
jgi:hypothetical protein